MAKNNSIIACEEDYPYTDRVTAMEFLMKNLGCRLVKTPPITIAFPPCTDVLLSPVTKVEEIKDDIKLIFREYFGFREHWIIPDKKKLPEGRLVECTGRWFPSEYYWQVYATDVHSADGLSMTEEASSKIDIDSQKWPSPYCLPPSCITLEGNRRLFKALEIHEQLDSLPSGLKIPGSIIGEDSVPKDIADVIRGLRNKISYQVDTSQPPDPNKNLLVFKGPMSEEERKILLDLDKANQSPYKDAIEAIFKKSKVRRLFLGDLVWLFYFERMGIFKILGVILDDYATTGKYTISNNSLAAIILEAMVRQIKGGQSSSVRDRDSTYRRCLGWTSDEGRRLTSDDKSVSNAGFTNLFHKFIQSALEFYGEKRLATAIRAQNIPGKPSVATLITIGDTLELLRRSLDPFDYGRNCYNTLNGVVWAIAGLLIIRELRTTLGIPPEYDLPYEYVPAAYDILVTKKPITSSNSESNRYILHRECAIDARDILLDIQVLRTDDPEFGSPGGELEVWLDHVEDRIEGYRTAYRSLTGIDLGEAGTPKVEQQV